MNIINLEGPRGGGLEPPKPPPWIYPCGMRVGLTGGMRAGLTGGGMRVGLTCGSMRVGLTGGMRVGLTGYMRVVT